MLYFWLKNEKTSIHGQSHLRFVWWNIDEWLTSPENSCPTHFLGYYCIILQDKLQRASARLRRQWSGFLITSKITESSPAMSIKQDKSRDSKSHPPQSSFLASREKRQTTAINRKEKWRKKGLRKNTKSTSPRRTFRYQTHAAHEAHLLFFFSL